jgi:phage terminase large subunit-like protein
MWALLRLVDEPERRYDDLTDSATQALKYLREVGLRSIKLRSGP